MRRGRGVATVLLAVAGGSAVGSAWVSGAFASAPSVVDGRALDAAVLSPRRAPGALVRVVADARLQGRVDGFLAGLGPDTCVAVDVGSRPVLRRNATAPLVPASTLKLLTARAAARKLSENFTFTTVVSGPGPDDTGVVAGDLLLTGTGDPLLATADYARTRPRPLREFTDFSALAERTVRAGVRRVTGRVVGVDELFDQERFVPTWKPSYGRDGDVGPIGALAVNDGFVTYGARPVAATDPALAAAEEFRRALIAQGVAVDGGAGRSGPDPVDKASGIAKVDSPPLRTILAELLTESDNNTAELLTKRLALVGGEAPATRAKGLAVARAALAEAGLPVADLVAVDGSGLDRSDRATCRLLLGALTPDPQLDLVPLLALAGRSGTLTDRFRNHPLEGRMRAKTGALEGVVGLVGVADPAAPDTLRFAFLANGSFGEAAGRQLQERFARVLATYPDAPAAAAVAP